MEFVSATTLETLCESYGLYAVFCLIALESMGIPMPGETVLIMAGVYAGTTHRIGIIPLIATATSAAIVGDNIGYLVGRTVGQQSLQKYGHRIGLNTRRIEIARHIFASQGGKIVFFGRFVALLRAFAGLLAGANQMSWPRFLAMNAFGGACWASLIGFGAYAFGERIERVTTVVGVLLLLGAAAMVAGVGVYFRRCERNLAKRIERSGTQTAGRLACSEVRNKFGGKS
jgi:membrane protein DedA with SNARE-associated domain